MIKPSSKETSQIVPRKRRGFWSGSVLPEPSYGTLRGGVNVESAERYVHDNAGRRPPSVAMRSCAFLLLFACAVPRVSTTVGATTPPPAAPSEPTRCREVTEGDGWTRLEDCPASGWWGANAPDASRDDASRSETRTPRAEARERLAALGLTVPVGARFREVEIVRYDVWGQAQTERARGILLPRMPGEPAHAFVDSWSPWSVRAFGPEIDALSECERAELIRERARELRRAREARREAGDEDAEWSSEEEMELPRLAAAACQVWLVWPLLDDLGHPEVADRAFGDASASEIFGWAVGSIVVRVFERAVTHYMQAEDDVARADLTLLARVMPLLDGLPHPPRSDHLETVPTLLAELERRVGTPRATTPDVPTEGPVDASSTHALIASLEEVGARQGGQPGGVELSRDPGVDALIRIGEPAVPALLECLEHDARLTRSVHFWREFVPNRTVLGVFEACYVALANILDEDFYEVVATGDNLTSSRRRGLVVQAVRAHWERWGSVPPVERRWQILSDDAAAPSRWAAAAEWLTTGGDRRESTYVFVYPEPEREMGAPLRRDRDEALRALLVRRADEALLRGASEAACTLVSAALVWANGPSEGVTPVARSCVRDRCVCSGWLAETLGPGDAVLAEEWVRSARMLEPWSSDETAISTAILLQEHPRVAREIDRQLRMWRPEAVVDGHLDTANRSPVVDRVWQLARHRASAREALLRGLRSRRLVARLELEAGEPMLRWEDGGASFEPSTPFDAPRSLRVADFVATTIANDLGVPFSLTWARPERDAAITELRRRVVRHPDPSVTPVTPGEDGSPAGDEP